MESNFQNAEKEMNCIKLLESKMKSKYIQKYKKIADKLIQKSFPLLKNEKIKICEKEMKSRGFAEFWPWRKRILISTKVRKYKREKIMGLLVHELSHCEMNKRKGFLWLLTIWILTHFSKKLKYKIEWETDMLAIEKGYGRYLLYSKKNQTEKQKQGYMPREKVRTLMKNFRKKDYKEVKI